ncbi:MAG: sulfite exporter TauE/SafE family protein [Syntrophobacteraceae bacterium]|nr:sulfite exporter TauE/SafE family protein [Syntrophobacteraceae bacterium]
MLNGLELAIAGLASVAGGAVNALAGGGTLITFPTLIALGIPAVASNVTNTVALCPGYLGGTFAQLKDLRGQKRRILFLLPAGVIGGLAGGLLLLNTGEHTFRVLVPYLILLASCLLAAQMPVRNFLARRSAKKSTRQGTPEPNQGREDALSSRLTGYEMIAAVAVALSAVYGGYFGAGLSVIVIAVLGLVLDDSLTRLNALKQFLAFVINVAAAVFFLFSKQVVWQVALVMAVGSILGGVLGGRLAGAISPVLLRRIVVTAGVGISIIYFVR